MQTPSEKRDSRKMRAMFDAIAPRYDFITRVFSYGMDRRWKENAVARAGLRTESVVLDLACGTGDFSRLAEASGARAIAVDLTFRMLAKAHLRRGVCADAMRLPFPDESFDAVFVGYGLRNFPDLAGALGEIRRVLRSGGELVSLDFFLPPESVFRSLYLGYLQAQGAVWGLLLHGSPSVYTYIPRSLRGFLGATELSNMLERIGFRAVRAHAYIRGGIAVHWGRK